MTYDHLRILDIGGRNINGTPRPLFPNSIYTVLDILPGENVHIVADASVWEPTRSWDLVISTEVFEHTPEWQRIIGTAYRALRPGGRFIATMAGPNRPQHSGIDGNQLQIGEYYGNIRPGDLMGALKSAGFVDIVVNEEPNPSDVRCVAYKPKDQ
jgi:SAM-dependent methyltransferase